MGANIYPEDIEQCLYADAGLAKIAHSFCLALAQGARAAVNPKFIFEVDAEPTAELAERYRDSILKNLIALNADFREAWQEYPETSPRSSSCTRGAPARSPRTQAGSSRRAC